MRTANQRIESVKFLTVDELKRLLAVIHDRRDRALFLLAYRHGLRASEIGELRTSDLDLKRMEIMLHRLKGSISGVHPLQPDEAKALKAYLKHRQSDSPILFLSRNNSPINRRTLELQMRTKYGPAAKLPPEKRHFHVLRHSIGVHLYEATGDVRFVQHWLGHSNIQNTVLYTHLTTVDSEEKARKAFAKLPRF
jgi:type 1 fimbriae regulatory protein FimB